MAIDDHLAFAIQLIQPLGELVHGQVDSASEVAELPFLRLADIREQRRVRLRQPLGQLARPELTHVLRHPLALRMHALRFALHFRLLSPVSYPPMAYMGRGGWM